MAKETFMVGSRVFTIIYLASTFIACSSEIKINKNGKDALKTNESNDTQQDDDINIVEDESTSDTAPLVSNLTPSSALEDTESVITLNYTDAEDDKATTCSVTNLSNITITSICICDGVGTCTVGVTGTLGYYGSASFDYSVTANSTISNTATASFSINSVIIDCPTGFVAVDGNPSLGTTDFCVMKYEAKCTSNCDNVNDLPISQAAGSPWVNIEAYDFANLPGSGAQARCEAMIEGGFMGNFSLISNPEWMTIARDIESVGANWSGGSIGIGELARGWTARTSVDGFQNSSFALITDINCIFNSGANTCAFTGDHKLKRTLQLSNGMEIWDFSGNVWSWVDWDESTPGFTLGPIDESIGYKEFSTAQTGSLLFDEYRPLGGYTSTQSAGRWYGGDGGATIRGGDYKDGGDAGIFSIYLDVDPASSYSSVGFRCTYRP